jgi:glycosyltransferase involved in cell wall biosynthesis
LKAIKKPQNEAFRLSIVLITYNHEVFLKETVNGIINQDFTDSLELIIADDASTDGTREIIENAVFPESWDIKKIYRPRNLGMNGNFLDALNLAKGEYVALIEGDDYWTEPQKCRFQVEYLQNNPSVSFSWHPVEVIGHFEYPNGPQKLKFEDEVFEHYIPTCSIVYRRSMLNTSPPILLKTSSLDIALELLLLSKGDAHKLDVKMGVYRKHEKGISSSIESQEMWAHQRIELYLAINKHTHYRYKTILNEAINHLALQELGRAKHIYSVRNRMLQVRALILTSKGKQAFKTTVFLLRKIKLWLTAFNIKRNLGR